MKRTIKPLIGALVLASLPALAQNFWTGQGTSLNWSDVGNWTAGVPDGSSVIWFEDLNYTTGYTNAAGAVNNIATVGSVAAAANYVANSFGTANHFYTTLIPNGVTLTLGGLGAGFPALSVGDIPTVQWLSAGSFTNYTTITGQGSLLVNDTASLISVGQRNRATLDLTGLNTFTANAKQLLVGATADNPTATAIAGALLLGRTNTITTAANPSAPGVILGSFNLANSTGILLLGGTNTINTDGLTAGGRRSASSPITLLAFGSAYSNTITAGNLTLRGSAGGSSRVSTFSVGDLAAQPGDYLGTTAGSSTAIADFSGGSVDIRADNIYVGRSAADPGPASSFTDGNGTLISENGLLDANKLYVGYKQGTNGSRGVGVVTLRSNAVMVVNNDVSLAFRNNITNGSSVATATLNVNNSAVLTVGGNITHGDGGISTIALGGGTIGMTGGGSIYAYGLSGSGFITNASSVTVTNNFTPGTATAPGTLNIGGNLSFPNPNELIFNLGGVANDYVNVSGDVSFNNNPLTLTFDGPLLGGSTYHLIDFTGSRSGSVVFNNATRSAIGLDQSTAGHLDLVVTNWTPATLTWVGNAAGSIIGNPTNNIWNTTSNNWNNSGPDKFYQQDHVVFDDTAVFTNIYPNGALYPASITINGSKNFALTNRSTAGGYQGFILGTCGITKNGTGTFLLGNQSNAFTGPILVNNGILRPFDATFTTPGNNQVLGSISTPMYVTNTGTFDVNGIGSISAGKQIVIKGTGFNGMGAITNGVSNSGATMNGYLLSLAGDATVSADIGGWGLRGPNSSGPPFYAGQLKLNGYTLTKVGAARFQMQEVMASDAGSINFNGGNLSLRDTVLSGAGTITFANNTYLQFPFLAGATSYVAKAISTAGNFGIAAPDSGSAASQVLIDSAVTLGGGLSLTNNQTLILGGIISGAQPITKYGNSNLVLNAANTYSGQTTIAAGTLSLGSSGSFASSPLVTVNPNTTLDVTAKAGTFALASGQRLDLNGTVAGDVTVAAGSTLAGAGIINGSLTVVSNAEVALADVNVTGTTYVSNNLTLAGGHFTWEVSPSFDISDALIVNGDLTLTGTNVFTLNSIGGFDPSGINTLITYNGTFNGGLTNLAVSSAARFVVEFLDPATTPGKIQVHLITPSPLLTWKGGNPSKPRDWDTKTTANWDNAGSPDVFWSSDAVRFDDTPNTNVVNLVGTLGPAYISMENSALSYTFGGSGGLVASSLTNSGGNLTLTNTANTYFTGVGLVLNGGNITFAQPTNTLLAANLNGFGTFTKTGNSNLLLTGNAANFTGTINVNGGMLRAGATNAVANTVNVASGATLDINGQLLSVANVSANGLGADGFGALNNRGGARTNALANLTLTGNTTVGALSNAWGLNGTLDGNSFALTKTNANDVWIQTGSETELGDIDVRQGRLVFARAGTTLGDATKEVIVRPNATLALAATNQMNQSGLPWSSGIAAGVKTLTLQNGATFESIGFPVNATTFNSFDGPISIVTNAVFKVGLNSTLVLPGPISGNGQLVVTNNGTLYLGGTNTYASNTFVLSGTLVLTNSQSLPTNAAPLTNGVLAISNNISTFGNALLVFDNGPVFPAATIMRLSSQNGQVSVGGNGTWNGPILMHGSNNNIFTFSGGTDVLDLAGPLITTNVGTALVNFHGSNTRVRGALIVPLATVSIGVGDGLGAGFNERFTTVTFGKSNFWSGTTVIDRGRVNLGTNNALPPSVPIRVGTLSAGVADRRIIFDMAGYNQTVSSLTEVAVGDSRVFIGNSSTNSNSTLTYAGTGTNTWGAIISDILDAPDVPHSTALTVTSGVLNLVNTNTYTGTTLVSGGRLNVILGSGLTAGWVGQLANSPVTVNGTGTLGGNGLIYGPVTAVAGGTVSPGVGVGTLTVENTVSLNAGSITWMDVNNSVGTNDLLVASGGITYGGTLVVTNSTPLIGYTNGQVLTLFSSGAGYNGSFSSIVIPGAVTYDATQLAVNGTITIVSAVSTAPAPITTTRVGNSLQLDWPVDHTGWRLQTQTNSLTTGISSTWYEVPGATTVNSMTLPIAPGNPTVFFRLIYP